MNQITQMKNVQKLFGSIFCFFLFYQAFSQTSEIAPKLVELNGKKVNVLEVGMEKRKAGQAVVILESGLGSPIESWNIIVDGIKEFSPLFAYERPGIGKSDMLEEQSTPEFIAQHLKDLLSQMNIPPPYILVGHSWGGPLINSYAVQFPEDVAGMLYIDETDILNMGTSQLQAIEKVSGGKVKENSILEEMNKFYQKAPPGIAAEWKVVYDLMSEDELKVERFKPELEVPVGILMSAKYSPPPPGFPEMNFDMKSWYKEMVKIRAGKFMEKIADNPDAFFILTNSAGHYIHFDDPKMVTEAIRRISYVNNNSTSR